MWPLSIKKNVISIPTGVRISIDSLVSPPNMQQMIDAIRAARKEIYLSKAPPHLSNTVRDNLIVQYNDATQELVNDPGNGFSDYTPPNFHTYFSNNPSEMIDDLHPDGTGYQSMARLWCESLNGQAGMACTP